MTTRKHKLNHFFFFPRLFPTTDLLLSSFPSAPPKLCGCSLCAVLQSGDRSSYCLDLIPLLTFTFPAAHVPSVAQDEARFSLKAGLFWQVPEGSDEG